MCGIAGIISLNKEPILKNTLISMIDSIRHRGPDGEGYWINDNIGIGHCRLSIVDLSKNANQPMIYDNNRYILSYNGEIYNYLELKIQLKKAGFIFRTKSDTEVVLYSLIHWGSNAIKKFNGMFAFAFLDNNEKKLLIGRDRYGIKPVYYSLQGKNFYFASEQKAIMTNKSFKKNLNHHCVYEYFSFQNILTDNTFLKDVKLLDPGSYLTLNLNNQNLKKFKYWDYHFREPKKIYNKKYYVEKLENLFIGAVKKQLIGDVEIGTYLSGGLDSSFITALASNFVPNCLKTFTCGFDVSTASGIELSFDERKKAELVASKFKTDHFQTVLKSGDMEKSISKVVWHLEEPRVGQSYPNYYISSLVSKFVKVILSGIGGDELFGGYPWRYNLDNKYNNLDDFIRKSYHLWQRLIPSHKMKSLFLPIQDNINNLDSYETFKNIFLQDKSKIITDQNDYINKILYFEAKTFLHGLFVVEDKLSMANSLETRVPFMDNDLVDFAMSCPLSLKLKNMNKKIQVNENNLFKKQFIKTNHGKKILREILKDKLPQEIVTMSKQGFSAPDASWFKGESIDFVRDKLYSNNALIYNYVDKMQIKKMLDEHMEGKENKRLLIWSLIYFEEYLDKFM